MTATTGVPAPAAPPARHRRWRVWWIAVAAAAVIALVAGLAAFLTLRSGEAAGGRVEVRSLVPVDKSDRLTAGAVQLPVGRLDVTATRPLTTVPDHASPYEAGRDLDRVHGFGRWVGVEWLVRGAPEDRRTYGWTGGAEQFGVTLVADGVRHDLAAGETADGTAVRERGYLDQKAVFVALPGEPGSLTLEVAYDGETQVLDLRSGTVDAGRAAPLYADPAKRRWTVAAADCTDDLPVRTPGFDGGPGDRGIVVDCETPGTAGASPYLPGRGWASPGRTYLTFRLTTGTSLPFAYWPAGGRGVTALYYLRLQESTLTVGGRGPLATGAYYQQSAAELARANKTGAFYSFEVPTGVPATGSLRQVYADLDGPGEDAPAGAPRQARGTVAVALTLTPPA